jgi:hypothetical protein
MKHVSLAVAATVAFALAAGIVNSGALRKPALATPAEGATEAEPASLDIVLSDAPEKIIASTSQGPEKEHDFSYENRLLSKNPEVRGELSGSPVTARDESFSPGIPAPNKPAPNENVEISFPPASGPRAAHLLKPVLKGPAKVGLAHAAPPNRTNPGLQVKHFPARQRPVQVAETKRERVDHSPVERRLGFSGNFGGCLYRGYVTAIGYQLQRSC